MVTIREMIDKKLVIEQKLWYIQNGYLHLMYLFIFTITDVSAKQWWRTILWFLSKMSFRPTQQETYTIWMNGVDKSSHHSPLSKEKRKEFSFLWKMFIKRIILNG